MPADAAATPPMTLYGAGASPFVRKVRIVIGELGLERLVGYVAAEGSPLDAPGLRTKNPLRKIPFLELADGQIVHDSRVVIEALLMERPEQRLLPERGLGRIEVLTRQSLADGLCDAAVAISYERRLRPEEKRWSEWIETQWTKVAGALDAAEAAPPPENRFDLGDCALAAALVYLDFRFPDRPWRPDRPALAAFFARAAARPSVAAAL